MIDKNGMDIEAIREAVHYQIGCLLVFLLHIASLREMSKTKVEVSKRKDYGERRVIRLEGAERKVAFSEAMGQNEEVENLAQRRKVTIDSLSNVHKFFPGA